MSDTISRQQAIDALKEKVFHNLSDEFYGAMQVLDELPSVQPEIIRCKDCLIHGVCRFEQGLGLNGYCSQAKRRTNG